MAPKFDVYAHVTDTIIAEIEAGTPPCVNRRPILTHHRRPKVTRLFPPSFPGSLFSSDIGGRARDGGKRTTGASGSGGRGALATAGRGCAAPWLCPGSGRPHALAPGRFGAQRDGRPLFRSPPGPGRRRRHRPGASRPRVHALGRDPVAGETAVRSGADDRNVDPGSALERANANVSRLVQGAGEFGPT